MVDRNAAVPTPDEIIGPAIDKLVSLRPRALAHINHGKGVYAHVFAGWRAQTSLMCRRLADFVENGRLRFASGAPLAELAGSEFDTFADRSATKAVGQVVLTRAPGRTGGTIRKGARFTRPADTSAERLFRDAQYECAVDTPVAFGATTVTVPLVAGREGSLANRPSLGVSHTEVQIADDIVDRTGWTVQSYEMGGGSDVVSDDDVKRYARAFSLGQYAATDRAVIAGALRSGAKRVLVVDDAVTATLQVYIADASWAGSTRWANLVRQQLADGKYIGFGCKVGVSFITNEIILVEATCRVRNPSSLAETSEIDVAIQKALRAYFDERPDFNRWRLSALRGVVARADRRLLSCSSVTVKKLDGTVLSEPAASSTKHFLMVDNSVRTTFLSPT